MPPISLTPTLAAVGAAELTAAFAGWIRLARRLDRWGPRTLPWNTEGHLETADGIVAYLDAVFEDGDAELIGHALGAVARPKAMTEIAQRTGVGRQSLYKPQSPEGRPEFTTVLKFVRARAEADRDRGLAHRDSDAELGGIASAPRWLIFLLPRRR